MNSWRPPEALETPRLRLERLTLEHAEAVFAGWAQDEEATRYLVFRPHTDVSESVAHAERCVARWEAGTSYAWVLVDASSGSVVGSIAAHPNGPRVALGYVMARDWWGRGLATEAVVAVSRWLLKQPPIHRVWAVCDFENAASARVLEKAGFQLEGTLRRWAVHPNVSAEPRDALCYSLVVVSREGPAGRGERDLQSVIDGLMDGGANVVESRPGQGFGLTFWLLRDPAAPEGFRMQPKPASFADMSARTVGFVGSEERPDDYPADAPFLPSAPAIINQGHHGVSVLWMDHPHPLDGYRRVLDQSLASGWHGSDEVPLATREARSVQLTRNGSVRRIQLEIHGNSGVLTLQDGLLTGPLV